LHHFSKDEVLAPDGFEFPIGFELSTLPLHAPVINHGEPNLLHELGVGPFDVIEDGVISFHP
jgi:hypothetical protein